jgi:hypothetical protein
LQLDTSNNRTTFLTIRLLYSGLLALCIFSPSFAKDAKSSKYEQPTYEVLDHSGNVEIRKYDKAIVAEVELPGGRNEALDKGREILTSYFSGNNKSKQAIAMTEPTCQQKMSVEVAKDADSSPPLWKVRFFMPKEFTMETAPKPNDERVKLIQLASERMASIRFSESPKQKHLRVRGAELQSQLERRHVSTIQEPIYAFYQSGRSLPLMGHNEILMPIDEEYETP